MMNSWSSFEKDVSNFIEQMCFLTKLRIFLAIDTTFLRKSVIQ